MKPTSILLRPPKQLSSCIAAAIFRDTRGTCLTDVDRFNYFPATPLVSISLVIVGDLRLVHSIDNLIAARQAPPLPSLSITALQAQPMVSWSPGEVCALTVGFYPDAWVKLGASPSEGTMPEAVRAALRNFSSNPNPQSSWQAFCRSLLPIWEVKRNAGGIPDWPGSDRLADWSRYLFNRVNTTAPGRSVRTLERRLRRWSGQSRQHLDHYAAIDELHRRTVKDSDTSLAGLATDSGFSDQSHMGRAVLRSTGFSPARLNHLIKTEESFWCYRLLGDRF